MSAGILFERSAIAEGPLCSRRFVGHVGLTMFILRLSAFPNSVWKNSLSFAAVAIPSHALRPLVFSVAASIAPFVPLAFPLLLLFFLDRCSSNGGSPPAGAVASGPSIVERTPVSVLVDLTNRYVYPRPAQHVWAGLCLDATWVRFPFPPR